MSKAIWGWLSLLLAIAGIYTLVSGLTGAPEAISGSGNATADGAVVLVLALAAFWRYRTKPTTRPPESED